MSVLARVVNLILLLIALIAASVITTRLSEREREGLMSWGSYRAVQILVSLSFFLLNIWLLSRFFDFGLAVLLLIGAYAGLLIAGFMWALLGSPRVVWRQRYAWAWREFIKSKPPTVLSVFSSLGSLIIIVGGFIYLALSINIVFRLTIPSNAATQLAFQITLALGILTTLILELPLDIGLLNSEHLDEDTRTGILVAEIGSLGMKALYLALFFWSFEIASGGLQFTVGAISLSVSPLVVTILSLFLLVHFLPYLAGLQRAKKTRVYFLEKKQSWLDNALDILDFPTPENYVARLELLRDRVEGEIKAFVARDWMVQKGLEFEEAKSLDEIDEDWESFARAFQRSRQLDPRFNYLDFLREFSEKVEECVSQLSHSEGQARTVDIAQGYAIAYRYRKDEFSGDAEMERKSRSPLWVGLTFVLSLLLAQIVSEVAREAWASLSGAAGP